MSGRDASAAPGFARRVAVSARALAPEQRRVAIAALLVLLSMFLPWYSKSVDAITSTGLASNSQSKLAITVPSFVEASIFLVAAGLLALMYARGQGRAFHLPFGDGIVATAAGVWTTFLIFFRFIDQPGGGKSDNIQYEYSLSWGIFFALLAALFLIYSGARLRLADVAEPPLPAAEEPTGTATRPARRPRPRDTADPDAATEPAPAARRPRPDVTTEVAPLEPPAWTLPERRRRPEDRAEDDAQLRFEDPQ